MQATVTALIGCAILVVAPSLASAFTLTSTTFVPHQSLGTVRATAGKHNHFTPSRMSMVPVDPSNNRRLLLHLLGAAGLAFPAVANAKLYEKVDTLLRMDELDQNPFDANIISSALSNDIWDDGFRSFFSNLRNSQKVVDKFPDIQETKNGYEIRVETPGVKKEDLKVEMVGKRSLIVSASGSKSSQKARQSDAESTHQESSSFRFWNEVAIPRDADTSRMKIAYDNSLLTVDIPRFGAGQMAESSKQKAEPEDKDVTARVDPKAEIEKELEVRMSKIEQLMKELEMEKMSARETKQKLELDKKKSANKRIQLHFD